MQRDPQVDLIFSHFIPRYEATGIPTAVIP